MFRTSLTRYFLLITFTLSTFVSGAHAQTDRVRVPGQVPSFVAGLASTGRLPAARTLNLAIGLPLRNNTELNDLLAQLYDPHSTNFHRFLTAPEFTARFGPTEQDYQTVIDFAEANGLTVSRRHANRLVLDVEGNAAIIERAFGVTLRTYRHPTQSRDFFAPDTEPSVPASVKVADMWGLSDYALPQPQSRLVEASNISPLNYNGTGPSGSYRGQDFRHAYAPGTALNGAGQTAAVAEFDGYYANDIATYESQSGYTNVPLQNIKLNNVSGTPGYSGVANAVAEVSLDIELIIAMAPGLSQVLVYEGSNPYTVFNQIAADDTAKQISCSWTFSTGPTHNWAGSGSTLDSILSEMVAQGQAFFQASGDSDAYTGSQALSTSSGPVPVDSIYLTSVGGTSLTMSGSGTAYSSETVWNAGSNEGSGGGISPNYPIPYWQTNVSMASNSGSTVNRNIPDVAMTADAVDVIYNNGKTGTFGGTSCAAPLWAGFCALVNQQATATGDSIAGFLNPALYAIANSTNYSASFHDITTGNNIGTHTAGLFNAVGGYDLATGLGTPKGVGLINELAPPLYPFFLTQPSGSSVISGSSVSLSATVEGQAPLSYQWLLNGTNLLASGTISGVTTNVLTLTGVTTNSSGDYSLVVTNSYGSITSSIAVLAVGIVPSFTAQPSSLTILSGDDAVFSATVTGSTPLTYQWRRSGTNMVNANGISGVNSNVLTVSAVTTSSSGSYSLYVTNAFGAAFSSVASLTVVQPPAITGSTLTDIGAQCGTNNLAFSITTSGTVPLSTQWSLDGVPVSGATGASLTLTNLHLPNHTVSVTVTNLYGSVSSNAVVTVFDTLVPAIVINGANPYYVEFGNSFSDPGATANDACAGGLPINVGGLVNTNTVSTNTLIYTADDGDGNTNMVSRTVIVRDTTPPTILWSFTNLVFAADTNCIAIMPDVTGTNDILATDLSEPLTVSQNPTNTALLPVGTNVVVISVKDTSGNIAYSTNTILVEDQTPPMITDQPQSSTNYLGSTSSFNVLAAACTPIAWQWQFNDNTLTAETNSTLTLTNLNSGQAGDYSVVITSFGGSVTSSVAVLTLLLQPSSIALSSSLNPSGFKDDVSFTATLSPTNAIGTIEFLTNGVSFDSELVNGGVAISTNLSALPRGTNLIVAVYFGDANDLPFTNSISQFVTNHPPTATTAYYTRPAGDSIALAITNLSANWSDLDGDPISLAAVSLSTNGVALTNTGTALVYFNPNDLPDQFTNTISDDWGGTNSQTVNIAVAFPGIAGISANADGSFTLKLTGAPGFNYALESTTNLNVPVNWLPLATNALGSNGIWLFNDAQATNFPQEYYRLKFLP